MDYQAFRLKAVEFMRNRDWKKKIAKRRGFEQSLFDHTLIEIDVLITLLPLLQHTFSPPLTESEEQVLLTSVLAHDVGKELDEWQEYVMGRRDFLSDVNRELAEEVVPELASQFGFNGVEEMLSSVLLHMRHERTPANVTSRLLFGQHTNPRWKTLADIVDAVDNLCSVKGLFAGLQYVAGNTCISNHLHTAYHLVQMRGISTTLLYRAAIDAFIKCGWHPLLHYSNGTLYVASSAIQLLEPSVDEIQVQMAERLREAMPGEMAKLIVGNPTSTIMPKPDLFDYRDLETCLSVAASLITRKSFFNKSESERFEVIGKYLLLSECLIENDPKSAITESNKRWKMNDHPHIDDEILASQTERITTAQPEMCVFKFFKAALVDALLGKQVTPEAEETYADFAEGGGKKTAPKVTPQSIARAEYDAVFGEGTYAELQRTSTLMPAIDMALTIDRFWELEGSRFGLDVSKIKYLLDDAKREDILIDTLVEIANKVYNALPAESRPTRATPEDIAQCFMPDLIHPSPQLNLDELIVQQMQAYGQTKANARKDKGLHICPICNQTFDGGTKAKADFVRNPEGHTNRGVSHGRGGQIVICETCKYERFLQQLLLGSQVTDILVLFPRMNIGHSSGEILRKKAIQIWEDASIRMTEDNPNPDEHITLSLTNLIARNISKNNYDVYRLTHNEIVELLTYESTEDTKKKHRKALDKELKEYFSTDELSVEDLNEEWATNFQTVKEAVEALTQGRIQDDDARRIRAKAFNLIPQFHIACQTPHMILIPTTNLLDSKKSAFQKKVGKNWESDTNTGIRELYLTLILGLSLDCSVAVVKVGEVITFEDSEGVVKVPAVPALRNLVGADWISIEDSEKWLDAIGAAALLANSTEYPERSNLYQILKSSTLGHVLRRIEQKSENGQAYMQHFHLLEQMKEVIR